MLGNMVMKLGESRLENANFSRPLSQAVFFYLKFAKNF